MTDHALQRKIDAQARRDAIAACGDCDEHGHIDGTHTDHRGTARPAVAVCRHDGRPLPPGFVPDSAARDRDRTGP